MGSFYGREAVSLRLQPATILAIALQNLTAINLGSVADPPRTGKNIRKKYEKTSER
jgi:hypothetical protein